MIFVFQVDIQVNGDSIADIHMKLDDNGTAFYLEGEGEKSNILNFKLFKTFVDLLFKMQIYLGMHIFIKL